MILQEHNCETAMRVGYSETDSCKNIQTENVYNIILVSKGFLKLHVNSQPVKSFAPCIWILKEKMNIEFVSSKKLLAQSICFNIAFLYRSLTFEMVNSGRYQELMNKLDLVPLNIFLNRSDHFSYVLPLTEMEYAQINNLFRNFYNAVRNQAYVRWSCLARQSLNGLLELLHLVYMNFINPNKQDFNNKNPQVWVQALLKKIHTNYSNGAQLSLAPLAKEIGINKDTVAKRFKEIVGCSVGDYIINYRIKCACYSLSNTELSIKEIACKCGFGSEAYFIRQFEKRKGLSPTQFRKKELQLRRTEFSSIHESSH